MKMRVEKVSDINPIITNSIHGIVDGKLYRYQEHHYASMDEYDNSHYSYTDVSLQEYRVIKETKCGAWIRPYQFTHFSEYKKFVNLKARKKFACISEESALESFIARKTRQISILQAQALRARLALSVGVNKLKKIQEEKAK